MKICYHDWIFHKKGFCCSYKNISETAYLPNFWPLISPELVTIKHVHMQTYILYIGIHCFKRQLIASINYLALWQLIHYHVLHIVPLHFHNKHVSNQSRPFSYRNEIQFVYSIFWRYSCGVYYFGDTHVETWLGRYI